MPHVFRVSFAARSQRCLAHVATMVALASCGGVSDGVTIPTTTPPPGSNTPTLIDLPVTPIAMSGIGVTQTITATIRDALGRTIQPANVVWSSDNPSVADVTSNGVIAYVVARAPGVTQIRATAGQATSAVEVRVLGVRALAVTPTSLIVRAGDLLPLSVDVQGDIKQKVA